jgi:hypothetical protein
MTILNTSYKEDGIAEPFNNFSNAGSNLKDLSRLEFLERILISTGI